MTNVISNPADKVKIKKMMGEISDSYTRIEAEQEEFAFLYESIVGTE